MRKTTLGLSAAFLIVATYAAGLTLGIGPRHVAYKFNEKIITPARDRILGPYDVLADYSETACPSGDHIAIGLFGQSNATNTVEPAAEGPFPANLMQFDWKSGRCFAYQEPLLGADFTRGNTITYAAIAIANQSDRPVVIAPFGFGPSSVLEWAYGRGATQMELVFTRMKDAGLTPQVFLWHQGESDLPLDDADPTILADVPYFQRPDQPLKMGPYRWGIGRASYREALQTVVGRTFDAFPDTRFGVALVACAPCLGRKEIWQPVRQAQQDVVATDARVFVSADSDLFVGPEYRYDTCHFSKRGAQKLSDAYLDSIRAQGILNQQVAG